MKISGKEKLPFSVLLYRILLGFMLFLALIFLAGTFYALFFRSKSADSALSRAILPQGASVSGDARIFTGLGRLRLSAADLNSSVILTITFPYPPEDRAYSEELAARVKDFRAVAASYFGSFSPAELRKKSEEQIKAELLEAFNKILRLGKIEILYFNDFMILD